MSRSVKQKTRIGEDNAERILDAAVGVFAAHGLTGARIDQIAKAAQISKPNLLYYFRTKEELYRAVLTRTLQMWLEPLRELDPARDPCEALRHYIEQKLAFSRSHAPASRLFAIEIIQGARHLSGVLSGELAALVEAKKATIEKWISDGKLAPIDPYHLIFMMWATTQHYADFAAQILTLTGRDLGNDEYFEGARKAVVNTLLEGVLPRRPSPPRGQAR